MTGKPCQQIVHFGPRRGRECGSGLALSVGSDEPAAHQHIFSDRESNSLLLLVTDQRKMGIKQVVGLIPLACLLKPNHVSQHLRESIARHGAVGTALHFEIQEQRTVAGEN